MDDGVQSLFMETAMRRFAPDHAAGSTFTLALTGLALRAVVRAWTALRNRNQVARLGELDDRALKDIGLLRTDVAAALSLPLHRDPSHHLAEVAGGGRIRRRPEEPLATAQDRARPRAAEAAVIGPAGKVMPC